MTAPVVGEMLEAVRGTACWPVVALALSMGAACGFDPSGSGARGGGGDGGVPDGGGTGADGGDDPDGGGIVVDADVPVSAFCQGGAALEACYELDGSLEDSSQNNSDLTGTQIGYDTGMSGQALMTTQSSKMDPIDASSLDFSAELTIEAYLWPSQAQDRWAIDHDSQWGLELEDDRVRCTVVTLDEEGGESTGHSIQSDSGSVPDDEWTHVACTYDGTNLKLYVDGIIATTPALVMGAIHTAPDGGFTIGRDAPDGSSWLGRLDRVRIWSVARNETQILDSL